MTPQVHVGAATAGRSVEVQGADRAAPGATVSEALPVDRPAWDAFVARTPAGDPLQLWAWGEVAEGWGEDPARYLARDVEGSIVAVAQALVRAAPLGRRMLYVPHGPVWSRERPEGRAALVALFDALRESGPAARGIAVKLDPRASRDGEADLLAETLTSLGCRPARFDLQARATRVLDLTVGEDALLAGLEKDTRNAVRRSAREGVEVRVSRGEDREACRALADLLAETGARAGVHLRDAAALERMRAEFAPAGGLYLVLAELAGRPIAGCLALTAGPRAYYLYAGSRRDQALRHAYGSYAALWGLCRALIADRRDSLDLWGVAEPGDPGADPAWQGFSLFKRGFGGTPLRHPGTYDLVLDPFWYRVRDWRERRAGRRT